MIHLFIEYNPQKYIRFENEGTDNELRMLNISDHKRVSLKRQWSDCRLQEESSRYIGCDGSEVAFSSSLFTIQRGTFYRFPYFLKVRKFPS